MGCVMNCIKANHRQKHWLFVFYLVVILATTIYFTRTYAIGDAISRLPVRELIQHRELPLSESATSEASDKWIVVTTINLPTQDVHKLANQPGWKLVVVGDKKTPKHWSLPGVVFLDVEKQMSLGYRILEHLPYGKYTRKAVGYLYAIQHGARCIYETDDDNSPTHGLSGFKCDNADGINLMMFSSNITENPYAHFGQSSIWPRGYPLDRVGLPVDYRYQVCSKATPTILQGVVNGDPDVDAVFRLTRRQPPMAFTLTFDSAAPPLILPLGTFAPFNSQNTFFLYRSLWAMILPVSVTDRATDIYRSYWAQRLLWLIGDSLAFLPPNAVQVRNLHSLLKDAQEEYELYQQMPRFVTVLNEWKCDRGDGTLFTCINQLSRRLVDEGFWKQLDADLVEAWLEDLTSAGYASPLLVNKLQSAFCEPDKDTPGTVRFRPIEQTTSMPHTSELHVPAGSTNHQLVYNAVGTECGPSHQLKWNKAMAKKRYDNKDVLLVLSVSSEALPKLGLLIALYQLQRVHVVYCLHEEFSRTFVNSQFIEKWKISVVWIPKKADAITCLSAAGKMKYGVKGSLYLSDRIFMKTDISLLFDQLESPLWMYSDHVSSSQQNVEDKIKQKTESSTYLGDALRKVSSLQQHNAVEKNLFSSCVSAMGKGDNSKKGEPKFSFGSEMSLLYIPQKLMKRFQQLRNILTGKLDPLIVPFLQCERSIANAGNFSTHSATAVYNSLRSSINVGEPLCSNIEQIN